MLNVKIFIQTFLKIKFLFFLAATVVIPDLGPGRSLSFRVGETSVKCSKFKQNRPAINNSGLKTIHLIDS